MRLSYHLPIADLRDFRDIVPEGTDKLQTIGWPDLKGKAFVRGFGEVEHRQPGDDGWFGKGTVCGAHAAIGFEPSARVWMGGTWVAPRVLYRQVASDGVASVRIDIGCRISGLKPFEVADTIASFLEMPVRVAVPRPNTTPQITPLSRADFRLAEAYLWASTVIRKDPSVADRLDDQLLTWLAPQIPCVIVELDPLDLTEPHKHFKPVAQWAAAGVALFHWPMLHCGRPASVWMLNVTAGADLQLVAQIRRFLVGLHAEGACLNMLLNRTLYKRPQTEESLLDISGGLHITPEPRSPRAQKVQFGLMKMANDVRKLDQLAQAMLITPDEQKFNAALVDRNVSENQVASIVQTLKTSFNEGDFRRNVRHDVITAVKAAPATVGLDPLEGRWTPFAEPFAPAQYMESSVDVKPEDISVREAGVLYWNTTLPKDNAAEKNRVLFINDIYRLRTAIEPAAVAGGGLTESAIVKVPDEKELTTNTEKGEQYFEVQFRFVVSGAEVRAVNSKEPFGAALTSGALRCVPSKGTDPFEVEVRSKESGAVSIEITLFVRGAAALRRTVEFRAINFGEILPVAMFNPPPATAIIGEAILSLPPVNAQLTVRLRTTLKNTTNYFVELLKDAGHSEPVEVFSTEYALTNLVITQRKELVELSKAYQAETDPRNSLTGLSIKAPADCLLRFARIGFTLHQAIFGRPNDPLVNRNLRDLANLIRQLGHTGTVTPQVQIDAELLPVPWAVLYDGPYPKKQSEVKPEHFWGRRFSINRVVSVSLIDGTLPEVPVQGLSDIRACINVGLDQDGISVVKPHRDFFEQAQLTASVIDQRMAFKQYVESEEPCKLLYFFCHATAAQTMDRNLFRTEKPPEDATYIDLDETPMSIAYLVNLRAQALPGRPLVFMNACSSSQGDGVFQSLFLTHFFGRWRACGFIGTDWEIPRVFADAFGRLVLQYFLIEKKTISEAFQLASNKAFELNNPFPLIYALYVRPDMRML